MHQDYPSDSLDNDFVFTAPPRYSSAFAFPVLQSPQPMIKHAPAAPQPHNHTPIQDAYTRSHTHGLTRLQQRLLYESDSDSSFDLNFSSPSSTGSASEYSDVGYASCSTARSSRVSFGRRHSRHHTSTSGSGSSPLGSSVAIQRVLMGTNTSSPSSSTSASAHSRKPQRHSVKTIASAFEHVSRYSQVGAPPLPTSRQSPLSHSTVPSFRSSGSVSARIQSFSTSMSAPPSASFSSRNQYAPKPRPLVLHKSNDDTPGRIKAGYRFPHSIHEDPFLISPRSPIDQIPQQSAEDDEPEFEIVPSPSLRRTFNSNSLSPTTQTDLSRSDSADSVYSTGSPHARKEPISRRMESLDSVTLAYATVQPYHEPAYAPAYVHHHYVADVEMGLRELPLLQPMDPELTPRPDQGPASSPLCEESTQFPLPPENGSMSLSRPSTAVQHQNEAERREIEAATQALQSEAQDLLASIRALTLEIEDHESPASKAYDAIEESYRQTWRVMDPWYWSSFEISHPEF
ncbi:hypothetical protein BCV70DRAFT_207911 [Testicularia cyperi]|uniref:Uncharacterized protein n=1 Tax=Testicularia cyperi TaxID=1882483 RepID=A0A317XK75_9BASI|nr:hypothetical protein BCV70DRAFT_207911 [Testicularia cyperi]